MIRANAMVWYKILKMQATRDILYHVSQASGMWRHFNFPHCSHCSIVKLESNLSSEAQEDLHDTFTSLLIHCRGTPPFAL